MTGFFRMIGHFVRRLLGKTRMGETGPMDSVVILFDTLPAYSDSQITEMIRRVFPLQSPKSLPINELPPPDYADPSKPARLVPFAVDRRVFGLIFGPFPYAEMVDSPNDPAQTLSTVKAFTSHGGWLAVDFVTGERPDDMYEYLGQIAAELITPEATLVFLPALSLVAHPTPELLEAMRQGQWIDQLEMLVPPMLQQRPANDPALQAATQEARGRLPEFVEAFHQQDGSDFSAKFPFADGDEIEHMWIAINTIDNGQVSGTLGNQPAIVTNIHEGDPVSRSLDDMEDWLYMKDEAMVGGFSVRVLLADGDNA